jgi:iduronate 2-sulfatase
MRMRCFTLFILFCGSGLLSAAEKPNILMICIDDMRPQLGCYGDKEVKSPRMDQLGAKSLIFDRAYCQQALCSPSRISLLSGRRPATSGIYAIGPTLRSAMPNIVTLPQHFKNHGYQTASLGKVYHVGIDDAASWSVPSWLSGKPRMGPIGRAGSIQRKQDYAAQKKAPPAKGEGSLSMASPAFEAVACDDDDLVDGDTAREACERLQTYAKKPGEPFFLAVGFLNPHVPWVAPKKYFDIYDPAQLKMADNNFPPRHAPDFAARTGADFLWYSNIPKDRKITPEFGRQCLHGYYAAISYVDAQVGRILDCLAAQKLTENTIVILWGDHGYYMGEHGWWGGKHNNYEGATRVALMVALPKGQAAGQHTRGLTEFVDIYPSLSELAGLPAPTGVEGVSFAPLFQKPDRPWKTAAFSEYPKGQNLLGTAMRTDRYRYVEWRDRTTKQLKHMELYDHEQDPAENLNIAAKPEHKELLAKLALQMQGGWQNAVPKTSAP